MTKHLQCCPCIQDRFDHADTDNIIVISGRLRLVSHQTLSILGLLVRDMGFYGRSSWKMS